MAWLIDKDYVHLVRLERCYLRGGVRYDFVHQCVKIGCALVVHDGWTPRIIRIALKDKLLTGIPSVQDEWATPHQMPLTRFFHFPYRFRAEDTGVGHAERTPDIRSRLLKRKPDRPLIQGLHLRDLHDAAIDG